LKGKKKRRLDLEKDRKIDVIVKRKKDGTLIEHGGGGKRQKEKEKGI